MFFIKCLHAEPCLIPFPCTQLKIFFGRIKAEFLSLLIKSIYSAINYR